MTGKGRLKYLEKASPAYKAYMSRNLLPKSAPPLIHRPEGWPRLHAGERFCRVGPCGAKFKTLGGLCLHMHQDHNEKVFWKPKEREMNETEISKADAFYRHVMRDEEYEGKVVGKEDESREEKKADWTLLPEVVQRTMQRCIAQKRHELQFLEQERIASEEQELIAQKQSQLQDLERRLAAFQSQHGLS